jgi:hypothetical protein
MQVLTVAICQATCSPGVTQHPVQEANAKVLQSHSPSSTGQATCVCRAPQLRQKLFRDPRWFPARVHKPLAGSKKWANKPCR